MDDEQLFAAMDHDERYRVVRTLAERPSGTTELVQGRGQQRLMVRKRVAEELVSEAAWQRLRDLDSPLLPHVRDIYRLPGELVIVTDYVEGITLAELVQSVGALEPALAAGYVADLCDAVAVLHGQGIIHRDLTPNNAVVSDGQARLIDLGNVRTHVDGAKKDTVNLGTWGFAPPEQFGFAQTDERSDVYALGCLLGYLLTGLRPSDESYDGALRTKAADLPRFVEVVERATSFEPSARYQSVRELGEAVGVLRGSQEAAPASATSEPHRSERPEASPASSVRASGKRNVATADTPQRFMQAAIPERLLAVAIWIALTVWSWVLIVVGVGELVDHNPHWHAAQYAMAAINVIASVFLSRASYRAVTRRGFFAGRSSIYGWLALVIVITVVVTVILMFAIGIPLEMIDPSKQS